MKKEKIIEILEEIYSELKMESQEYADYVNEKHCDDSYKLDLDAVYAYRTGAVQAQIEYILKCEGRLH